MFILLISRIITGDLKENCYIIETSKKNCLIFDPGADFNKINNYITKNNLHPTHIFLTHGHYDHIGAIPELKEKYSNLKIAISKEDQECLKDGSKSLASTYGYYQQRPLNSDIIVKDNLKINIDDISITCIFTPGHTLGGFCYLINKEALITGDTIFKNSIGRSDLYGGNQQVLLNSIKKIYTIIKPNKSNPIKIYPGHWLTSTLEKELYSNPYLKFLIL